MLPHISCPTWVIFTRKKDFIFSHVTYCRKSTVCMYNSCWQYQLISTNRVTTAAKYTITLSALVFIYMGHHVLSFAKFITSKLTNPHICWTHLLSPCRNTWRCTWKYSFITVRMFICVATSGTPVPWFIGQSSLYTLWREETSCSSSLS